MDSTNEKCPVHGLPIQQDEQYVMFRCGKSPYCTMEVKLRATWCPHPECHETTKVIVIPNKTGKIP